MVTCLSENGECNYLIKLSFWWRFRRVWIAQGRWLQVVLMFQKAWRRLSEGSWVVKWSWNNSKLGNRNSILREENQICSRDLLALKFWFFHGTPFPIYREGVWIVWREKSGGSFKKGEARKFAQKWNLLDKYGWVLTWYSPPLSLFCIYHALRDARELQ